MKVEISCVNFRVHPSFPLPIFRWLDADTLPGLSSYLEHDGEPLVEIDETTEKEPTSLVSAELLYAPWTC